MELSFRYARLSREVGDPKSASGIFADPLDHLRGSGVFAGSTGQLGKSPGEAPRYSNHAQRFPVWGQDGILRSREPFQFALVIEENLGVVDERDLGSHGPLITGDELVRDGGRVAFPIGGSEDLIRIRHAQSEKEGTVHVEETAFCVLDEEEHVRERVEDLYHRDRHRIPEEERRIWDRGGHVRSIPESGFVCNEEGAGESGVLREMTVSVSRRESWEALPMGGG